MKNIAFLILTFLTSILFQSEIFAQCTISASSPSATNDSCFTPYDQVANPFTDNDVLKAVQLRNGNILLAGRFKKFDDQGAHFVCQISQAGSLQPFFKSTQDFRYYEFSGNNPIVSVIEEQQDQKILLGGTFDSVRNNLVRSICRVLPNGDLDTTFQSRGFVNISVAGAFTGSVNAIQLQQDGKIMVCGTFNRYGTTSVNSICRLYSNGQLDTTFKSPIPLSQPMFGGIAKIALQPDGKIVICGSFDFYSHAPAQVRASLFTRLNSNGDIDVSFNHLKPNFASRNVGIYDFDLQGDGKIIVGAWCDLNSPGAFLDQICRLNINGSRDVTFNSNGTLPINAAQPTFLRLQTDQKILVVSVNTNAAGYQQLVTRYKSNGTYDTSYHSFSWVYNVSFRFPINTSLLLRNDKLFLTGQLFDDAYTGKFMLLGPDGDRDTTLNTKNAGFKTLPDGAFSQQPSLMPAISLGADESIFIGGDFTTNNGLRLGRIVKLDTCGRILKSFNTNGFGFQNGYAGSGEVTTVRDIIGRSDGKLLVFGYFSTYNGSFISKNHTRLNADGSIDAQYDANLRTYSFLGTGYYSPILFADQRFSIIHTRFVGADLHSSITRFSAEGLQDITFNPTLKYALGTIYKQATLAGNSTIIGGNFSQYDFINRSNICKLNTDATIDLNFLVGAGFKYQGYGHFASVYELGVQVDGKILVGGLFDEYNGRPIKGLVCRLLANGQIDNTFAPTDSVGMRAPFIPLPSGEVLLTRQLGNSPTARYVILRVKRDGKIDSTFDCGEGFNDAITSMKLQPDGHVIVSGYFTKYRSKLENGLTRIIVNNIPSINTAHVQIKNNREIISFPNPAVSAFMLTSIDRPVEVLLYDLNGRLVRRHFVSSTVGFDLNGIGKGLYFWIGKPGRGVISVDR